MVNSMVQKRRTGGTAKTMTENAQKKINNNKKYLSLQMK